MVKKGKNISKEPSFWREVFSENGIGSSKRLIGSIMTVVALCCIVLLVIREGGTDTVESLLQTAMIVGSSLLGLYSITSIWKNGSVSAGMARRKPKKKEEDTEKDEESFED